MVSNKNYILVFFSSFTMFLLVIWADHIFFNASLSLNHHSGIKFKIFWYIQFCGNMIQLLPTTFTCSKNIISQRCTYFIIMFSMFALSVSCVTITPNPHFCFFQAPELSAWWLFYIRWSRSFPSVFRPESFWNTRDVLNYDRIWESNPICHPKTSHVSFRQLFSRRGSGRSSVWMQFRQWKGKEGEEMWEKSRWRNTRNYVFSISMRFWPRWWRKTRRKTIR